MRRLRSSPAATVGAMALIAITLGAVLAPLIAPYPADSEVGPVYGPPSNDHLLGLDDAGHDVLSTLIYGARVSLIVGFAAALVAMIVGGVVGILAGYYRGTTDTVLMRITDYFIVVPTLPLAITVAALWGPSLVNIIIVIGLLSWSSTARLVRAQTKSLRERAFVRRSRALGASHTRILVTRIVPHLGPLLVANTVLAIAGAIFAEASLSFLGLSDPTAVSWGKMIGDAFQRTAVSHGAWWAIVPPGIAIGVVVLACTLVGRHLEDSLNPRLEVSHLSARSFDVGPWPAAAAVDRVSPAGSVVTERVPDA